MEAAVNKYKKWDKKEVAKDTTGEDDGGELGSDDVTDTQHGGRS